MEIKEEFSSKSEVFEWMDIIVYSLIGIILFMTFFFRFSWVEGSSMRPTLINGDGLIVSSPAISKIEKGDIIITTQPTIVNHPLIKRVIATEGQTVNIDFNSGNVYVDGILLDEPYISERINRIPNDPVKFPFKVSKNHVFVLGDNRNGSSDSRNAGIGEIDTRYILGNATYRIFPFKNRGKLN